MRSIEFEIERARQLMYKLYREDNQDVLKVSQHLDQLLNELEKLQKRERKVS
ncbi:aspartyl-phosphate phosphatase Spo0E family protein [Radiobacillus kanasensis]|uniref:aspartyl-phosphate phosphatase Spo0E family protein n=1 Tax=Radiobacillus kanasensis TaxID=2844358 RepID=UPI001E42839B|nr:aspartyl-phosphate phosphatase Spo0E family protein [Radiobacillus kanasensis]UFU01316.1 aspartyl-phosphate phosphatase Spo0E family protein [Radiobacillus kanasensis]